VATRAISTEITRLSSTSDATTRYSGPGGEIEDSHAAPGITATAGTPSHSTLSHSICDQILGSITIGISPPRKFASMMPSCAPISTTAYGANTIPSPIPATRWMIPHTSTRAMRARAREGARFRERGGRDGCARRELLARALRARTLGCAPPPPPYRSRWRSGHLVHRAAGAVHAADGDQAGGTDRTDEV